MSANEELRRLLDERGVEWRERVYCKHSVTTFWHARGVRWHYRENRFGELRMHADDLTPEQAVEATLERETCRMTRVEDEKRILCGWVECSECGPVYPPAAKAIQDAIRFCPYCGRKVVA